MAQTPPPPAPSDGSTSATGPAAASGPQSPQWSRLSVEDKLKYDGRHMFDVDNIIFAGIGAAFDQGRDRPGEWGQGWGAFGERYASHLGQYAIQRSIMFPVQAIDHEDARYFRSTRTSIKGRVGDAFLHTVWRHDDSGGMMLQRVLRRLWRRGHIASVVAGALSSRLGNFRGRFRHHADRRGNQRPPRVCTRYQTVAALEPRHAKNHEPRSGDRGGLPVTRMLETGRLDTRPSRV